MKYATSAGTATTATTANAVAWDNVTGKPSTYTPASHTHSYITNSGNQTALSAVNSKPTKGLSIYSVYNNGYPCSYGNVLSIGGTGQGQIVAGWSGSDAGIERLYYRNKRDNDTCKWSEWRTVAFTTDIPTNFPSKTGTGASGTWGISISGNAATATKATSCTGNSATASAVAWSGVSSKPASIVKVSSWDGSTLNLTTCT